MFHVTGESFGTNGSLPLCGPPLLGCLLGCTLLLAPWVLSFDEVWQGCRSTTNLNK